MKTKLLFLALGLAVVGGCAPSEDVETVDNGPRSIPGQAVDRAKTVELDSNISQVRQFVGMFRQDNGRNPTYDELKHMRGLPPQMLINPVDGKPLLYDEASGMVYAQGGKAPDKVSRASQINNSENGSSGPPPAALPQTQPAPAAPAPPADPDAPAAPVMPKIPVVPAG